MRGFTLIELLVVIVIISITVTFASFAVMHSLQQRQIKIAAETLNTLLSAAQQQAILQANTLGLRIEKHSYEFYQWHANSGAKGQWQAITSDRLLSYHDLGDSILLTLKISSPSIEKQPQIIFYSDGEMTAFTLLLSIKNSPAVFQLRGETNGTIQLKKLTPAAEEP